MTLLLSLALIAPYVLQCSLFIAIQFKILSNFYCDFFFLDHQRNIRAARTGAEGMVSHEP